MALLITTACSGSSSGSSSTVKPSAGKAGRAERVPIGTLEAYALEDGQLVVPNDGQLLGVGRSPAETGALLAAAGLPHEEITLDIQCLLVKAGDRVILFDTGGGDLVPGAGHLPQSLELASVAPAAVTDIFISHAHSDHLGGLLTNGALSFSAATIHMSVPEWAALQANTDDVSKRFVATIADKVSAFEPGAQVLPIVKAVATPGHTPGHSSYEIGEADKMFYLGDVAHHSVISVQRPAWSMQVDADHARAAAMRADTLARLAGEHTRVFAGHFPFPGLGQVVAQGEGVVWKPGAR